MLHKYLPASGENIRYILKLVLSAVFSLFIVFIFISVAAFAASKFDFSYSTLPVIITTILSAATFFNGFVLSRLYKENGLFWGVFAAVTLMVLLSVVSVSLGLFGFTHNFFTKLIAVMASGAIGGIIGVNTN